MNREQQEQKQQQQQQQQQQQELLPPPAPASEFCTHRLVVDYVVTVEHFQGRGYASHLLELAVNTARAAGANVYVLALEDSCVYWMSKGFVLEDGAINRRLNVFPDTHLLKLPSNRPEEQEPVCLEV